jgi:hypothetical protein
VIDVTSRLALASLALTMAGCAAYTRPAVNEAAAHDVARALGARTTAKGCPYGQAELTAKTIAALQNGASSHPWGPEWACLAIEDDLAQDSMGQCAPPPDDVFDRPLAFPRPVVGHLYYVGLDPRQYAYDLVPLADGVLVEVRVELMGGTARDPATIAAMQRKMDQAAQFWTAHSPGQKTRFRFVAVTSDDASPHFDVRLSSGEPRSPFDVGWGTEWSWHLLAHEIGHMMGLDDEYGQLRKTLGHALGQESSWQTHPTEKVDWFHCDPASVMCDSKGEASVPQPYHYYMILRRRFCRVTPSDQDILAP